MMPEKRPVLILFLFCLSALLAHEYILIPDAYRTRKGASLQVHLFVADGFNVQLERPMQKGMTRRFELLSENGSTDLLIDAREGSLPLLDRKVDFEGLGLIHLERDYSRITLPNDEFEEYLQVDNIENVSIKDSGKKEQTERYSRYIKTLIQSNPKPADTIYRAQVGHILEIILLDNPYQLKVGDWIRARVFYDGQPLSEKVITARNRIGNKAPIFQYSRTDDQGYCSFKLERAGDWFLHTTHMIPCPDPDDTDWESFWTSYSFGIAEVE